MGYGYDYDGPPTKCSGGPRAGTIALRDGTMERFGCGDQGIFNCRTVRVAGDDTLSFHADGRAWDAECSGDLNAEIAKWLVVNADALGVQEVISQHERWTSQDRKWHPYHGDDPHTGHVHVSQCKAASLSLTLAVVRAIDSIGEDDDMKIIAPTIGPDKDKSFLVGNGAPVHIPTPRQLTELEAIYGPMIRVSDVTWDVIRSTGKG